MPPVFCVVYKRVRANDRSLASSCFGFDMLAWLHPFVQHADDLDDAGFVHAIEQHVDGINNLRLTAFAAGVFDMETAKAFEKFAAIDA